MVLTSVPAWVTRLICPQCGSRVMNSIVGPKHPGWIK